MLPVTVCMLLALGAHVLFHGWVDEQFFCDGVAGEFPCELVAVAGLVVNVSGVVDDFVVVGFEFAVVFCNSFRNGGVEGDLGPDKGRWAGAETRAEGAVGCSGER